MKTNHSWIKQHLDFDTAKVRLIVAVIAWVTFVVLPQTNASDLRTKNVFLITTDGLRWQEVFTGAEELLLNKTNGGVSEIGGLKQRFWRERPEERRKALLPFLWGEVAAKGQIYGNQAKGSVAHITNGKKFSYPGYSEFLTGVADARIDSNNKVPNLNTNVFEWLNLRPGLQGKVAAVVNWDVIPWILNTERSQLQVWSGFPLQLNASVLIKISPALDELVSDTTSLWSDMIFDSFTFQAARAYIKQEKPRAFYISFSETDEWAHEGRYDQMLDAAHKVDSYIQRLWEMVQTMPAYRNKTTFIIATDHGRGLRPACLARSRQGSGRRGKHLDRRDRPRHAAVGRTDKLCASYTKPDRRHGCGIVG